MPHCSQLHTPPTRKVYAKTITAESPRAPEPQADEKSHKGTHLHTSCGGSCPRSPPSWRSGAGRGHHSCWSRQRIAPLLSGAEACCRDALAAMDVWGPSGSCWKRPPAKMRRKCTFLKNQNTLFTEHGLSKKDKWLFSLLTSFLIFSPPFNGCLRVVLQLDKGDYPQNLQIVYLRHNK